MRYSFLGHLISGILTVIAIIFSSGALFSCCRLFTFSISSHFPVWTSFYVSQSGRLHGSGLFGQGTDGLCRDVYKVRTSLVLLKQILQKTSLPGFVSATLAFMFIGFGLQILQAIMLIVSWWSYFSYKWKALFSVFRQYSHIFLKIDVGFMIAIFLCFTTSCIVYGTASQSYFHNLFLYEVDVSSRFVDFYQPLF